MTPHEYQFFAEKTENQDLDDILSRLSNDTTTRLLHAAMGMVTETGEFTDILKKWTIYGKDLDFIHLAEELGDLMWYIALACNALGINLEDVMAKNIEKLQARYPARFTAVDALHRNLDKERKILED